MGQKMHIIDAANLNVAQLTLLIHVWSFQTGQSYQLGTQVPVPYKCTYVY